MRHKKKFLILLIVIVVLVVVVGIFYFLNNIPIQRASDSVLLEAQVGGAWGGPKYTLCNDGKFFVNNFLSASLDSSAIDYLKSIYGKQSIDVTFSSDVAGAYDAYRTFHLKYYGKRPVKDKDVSLSLESLVENIDEAISRKTPKTKVMEIGTGRVFKATEWNQVSNLFKFNQDEHYLMFPDKLFGDWPLLNEQQLAFANSIAYPIKAWNDKRYNYYIKDNEIFNIAVNNLEGKFYFDLIFGPKNLYPAERIKEFDPDLYSQFLKEADNYRPDYQNVELYTLRYQPLDTEKSNLISQFNRDAYFYIIKDGYYYILPIKFSEREETGIYKYTEMPIVAMSNFSGDLNANEWTADKNLFPFNDIYEAGEIQYTLKGETKYNRYELNQQQLDFVNQLPEGRSNYIVDNRLFVLDKNTAVDNIFIIKRFTLDDKYTLVLADLLKLLDQNFEELYQNLKSKDYIEGTKIIPEEQKAAFNNLPNSPAFYVKDGDNYKIITARLGIAKQFVSPYENLKTAEEFCKVQVDKNKILNISMLDILF